jgi:hypothetical protein
MPWRFTSENGLRMRPGTSLAIQTDRREVIGWIGKSGWKPCNLCLFIALTGGKLVWGCRRRHPEPAGQRHFSEGARDPAARGAERFPGERAEWRKKLEAAQRPG